ncbi:hypothetical protein ScalyP_jg8870 [Parmales sp. scaly parma]|nr:hypothetical protein ScalyP_jg8870 [Parmales sp. scaly parma]
MNKIDKCTNGEVVDFDDGHIPLICKLRNFKTRIVQNQVRQASNFFSVYENAVDPALASLIYDASVKLNGRPWGTYHYLAVKVVAQFIISRVGDAISSDYSKIHGTAVWALSASPKSEVQYHIDYAELVRYETNIIYPPIYAGTLHCSNMGDGEIVGGKFEANLEGLSHYEKVGYKGKKLSTDPTEFLEKDRSSSSAWMSVPYRFNRGIFHDGDLPHLSTRIEALPADKKRVIVGLNMFGHDCGPSAMHAPEHSNAFNRQVKLYQLMAKTEGKNGLDSGGGCKKGLNLGLIKENKALSKLLVLAKREKVKQELRLEAEKLDGIILGMGTRGEKCKCSVKFLIEECQKCTKEDENAPNETTIHIHINQMIRTGKLRVVRVEGEEVGVGGGNLVQVDEIVCCC